MTLTDANDISNPSYVVDLSRDKDFQTPSSPAKSIASNSSSNSTPTTPLAHPPKQLIVKDGKVISFNFDD